MRTSTAWVAVALVASLCGCNGAKKRDLKDFEDARVQLANAKSALAAGDLTRAHETYQQVETLMIGIRSRATPPMEEQLAPGRVLDGQTAQAWREQWLREWRQAVADSFDDLETRAVDGTLDWLDARAFFTTYGDEALDRRWRDAVPEVDRSHGERSPERYVWRCDSVLDGYCEALLGIFTARAALPLATEQFLSSGSQDALRGKIEVKAATSGDAEYEPTGGGTGTRADRVTLPTRLVVSVDVTTNRGHSSWDGHHELTVDAEPPTGFQSGQQDELYKKQLSALQALMAPKLDSLKPQTLE